MRIVRHAAVACISAFALLDVSTGQGRQPPRDIVFSSTFGPWKVTISEYSGNKDPRDRSAWGYMNYSDPKAGFKFDIQCSGYHSEASGSWFVNVERLPKQKQKKGDLDKVTLNYLFDGRIAGTFDGRGRVGASLYYDVWQREGFKNDGPSIPAVFSKFVRAAMEARNTFSFSLPPQVKTWTLSAPDLNRAFQALTDHCPLPIDAP